eukprot:1959030-Rhodomonas_salina.2
MRFAVLAVAVHFNPSRPVDTRTKTSSGASKRWLTDGDGVVGVGDSGHADEHPGHRRHDFPALGHPPHHCECLP